MPEPYLINGFCAVRGMQRSSRLQNLWELIRNLFLSCLDNAPLKLSHYIRHDSSEPGSGKASAFTRS